MAKTSEGIFRIRDQLYRIHYIAVEYHSFWVMMGVLSSIEHGSAIQTTIFGHMGLWYVEKVRGEGGAHGSGLYLRCTHGLSILARGYLNKVDI